MHPFMARHKANTWLHRIISEKKRSKVVSGSLGLIVCRFHNNVVASAEYSCTMSLLPVSYAHRSLHTGTIMEGSCLFLNLPRFSEGSIESTSTMLSCIDLIPVTTTKLLCVCSAPSAGSLALDCTILPHQKIYWPQSTLLFLECSYNVVGNRASWPQLAHQTMYSADGRMVPMLRYDCCHRICNHWPSHLR